MENDIQTTLFDCRHYIHAFCKRCWSEMEIIEDDPEAPGQVDSSLICDECAYEVFELDWRPQ